MDEDIQLKNAVADETDTGAAIPKSFPKFRNLPPELQIKIWKNAFPEPRVIKIQAVRLRSPAPVYAGPLVRFSSDAVPSSLLATCQDSRVEILKYYNVCIQSEPCPARIRLNGDIDTVVPQQGLDPICYHGFDPKILECFAGVKNISLALKPQPRYIEYMIRVCSKLPSVRNLLLPINASAALRLGDCIQIPQTLQLPEETIGPNLTSSSHVLDPLDTLEERWSKAFAHMLKKENVVDSWTRRDIAAVHMALVPCKERSQEPLSNCELAEGKQLATSDIWYKNFIGVTLNTYLRELFQHGPTLNEMLAETGNTEGAKKDGLETHSFIYYS